MRDANNTQGRQLTAWILLGVAAYIILAQVGVLDALGIRDLVRWIFRTLWNLLPAALFAAGMYWVYRSPRGSKPLVAWFIAGFGLILLISQADLFGLSFGELFLPLWLVIIALVIMNPREILPRRFNMQGDEVSEDADELNLVAFMGGGELNYSSKTLRGGQLVAIWGGYQIDFSDADMEGDSMELDVMCIMGGFEITVPAHWEVQKQGAVCIMGGFSNKTKCIAEQLELPRKRLIIKGIALMGGGEFKN